MRGPLVGIDEGEVLAVIRSGWGLAIEAMDYVPVGGGAYHWQATDESGARWFVTVDDLDGKPWLGPDRDTVFASLLGCYGTAAALRSEGLTFVVGPMATTAGVPAVRLDDRHSAAVCEHVDGTPGSWGSPVDVAVVEELVDVLARLHGRAVPPGVRPAVVEVIGRAALEEALHEIGQPWAGGPLGEEARALVGDHADQVRGWLDEMAVATARLTAAGGAALTHGEPHPGNLIATVTGLRLIDWDTVAAGPVERDLWLLAEADPTAVDRYRERTGAAVDDGALAAFRRLWALSDLDHVVRALWGSHDGGPEDQRMLVALRDLLAGDAPAPYGH